MASLREKQQAQRRQRILEEAAGLFNRHGMDISVDDIATHAEVGVATVYNYFHTKTGLIMELISRETERVLAVGKKVIDNPPPVPEDAVSKLLTAYFYELGRNFSKPLFRDIMTMLMHSEMILMNKVIKLDKTLIHQVEQLIKSLQEKGDIAADINPFEASTVLYGMAGSEMLLYLYDDDMPVKDLKRNIKDRTRLIFRGLSPR